MPKWRGMLILPPFRSCRVDDATPVLMSPRYDMMFMMFTIIDYVDE